FCSTESQLHMGTVHGVARLKSNHTTPAEACKFSAQFAWSQPEGFEVIVRRKLQPFELSTYVPRIRPIEQIIHTAVGCARRAKNRLRLSFTVRLPHLFNIEHREHHAFRIAQSDLAVARLKFFRKLFSDVESDRHGPQQPAT